MTPTAATLRDARESLGLRQADVAQRAECAISVVSMAENGYRPGPGMRARLGAAVGASAGMFWPEDRQATT